MAKSSHEKADRWLEVTSALLLSASALLSSWATYQSSLWDGEQAAHYSQANALRIEASRAALEDDTRLAIEVDLWGRWLDATAQRQVTLARFYQARFPPHMKHAFNAWLAERPLDNPSATPTPFGVPAYRRAGQDAARNLDAKAAASFAEGQRANDISDAFSQSATILATSMFFAGIGQVFELRSARVGLLAVAALALILGVLRLVSLPMQVLGFGPPG